MQKAREYFENNYGKGHIESVTEMKDFISLYALMEEYAEEQVKLFAIPDVRENALDAFDRGFTAGYNAGVKMGLAAD